MLPFGTPLLIQISNKRIYFVFETHQPFTFTFMHIYSYYLPVEDDAKQLYTQKKVWSAVTHALKKYISYVIQLDT